MVKDHELDQGQIERRNPISIIEKTVGRGIKIRNTGGEVDQREEVIAGEEQVLDLKTGIKQIKRRSLNKSQFLMLIPSKNKRKHCTDNLKKLVINS